MDLIIYLIGRNPKGVEKILGPYEKKALAFVNKFPPALKAFYLNESIEIIYLDNVADWITIHSKQKHLISNFVNFFDLLDMLPNKTASYDKNSTILIYKNIEGIRQITLCLNGQKEIVYLSIKAFTD